MESVRLRGVLCLLALAAGPLLAQGPDRPADTPARGAQEAEGGVLRWTPPAWAALGEQAEMNNSFVLDRTALGAVAALMPDRDAQVRPAIRKLDGIGVHLYRFHDAGQMGAARAASIDEIRQAYRARGWKHIDGGNRPVRNGTTDVWFVMDGVEVRGGAMLIVTPRSASLITFAGDLNPIDLLHLRGHFGIPKASSDEPDGSR